MAKIVSWHWDFGDGESSTVPNPIHVYPMAGEYFVIQTVTDDDGNVYVNTGIVFVYDFDYRRNSGIPNTSLLGKCYRLPVRAGEGFGVSEYIDNENPGLDWIWPPSNIQIGKGYDKLKKEIALVLDSKTQREYQVNDEEIWRDRVGNYGDGNVIKSGIDQRGHFSSEGEHVPIRHIEHHEVFKSFDRKRFQDALGYDGVGLPAGFRVDNQLFQDGEPFTPVVEAKKIPLDGDLVFQERVEARNLQLKTIIRGAPYWLTGILAYYETVDKSGTPSLKVMTEDAYQIDMASMPIFHVSRNFNPILNLATGLNASGTFRSLITGPEGREMSALQFGMSDTGIRDTLAEAISGDFTLYVWIKNFPQMTLPLNVFNTANFIVELVNPGYIALSVLDPSGGVQLDLETNGNGWMLISIVRFGMDLKIYKNKTLLGTFALPAVSNYGSFGVFGGPNIAIFDPCIVPRAVNADGIEYYYDDIIRGGEQVLQPF